MRHSTTLKCALLAAGLALFGCSQNNGTALDTTTRTSTNRPVATQTTTNQNQSLSSEEQRFVAMLTQHHQNGVDLAEQGRRQGSQRVKDVAARMLQQDSQHIQQLSQMQASTSTGTSSGLSGAAAPSQDNSSYSSGNMASGQGNNLGSSGSTTDQSASDVTAGDDASRLGNSDNTSDLANNGDDTGVNEDSSASGSINNGVSGTESSGSSANQNGATTQGAGSSLGAGVTDGPVGLNSANSNNNNASGSMNNHDMSGLRYDGPRTAGEVAGNTGTFSDMDLGPTQVMGGEGSFDERWAQTMIQHERAGVALIERMRDQVQNERLRQLTEQMLSQHESTLADLQNIGPAVGQEADE